MRDVHAVELAAKQFNRFSRTQLLELGFDDDAISLRVQTGRWCCVEQGVFGIAPIHRDDDWGKWMGATLTAPHTYLSHVSAAAASGFWTLPRDFETVTRPGDGGPRRHGVLVFRSSVLEGETTFLQNVPITTAPRTLLDLARGVSDRALARAVREAIRLERTTLVALGDVIGRHYRRRGSRRLAKVVARYSGLPLERARSGAEIRAMDLLRGAGKELPDLNRSIAGEEADLSWAAHRLIVEIDGRPFHLDEGEDARKEEAWTGAGWTVLRIQADHVYERPSELLALAPS
jgi:uncharacterized protein DUF559